MALLEGQTAGPVLVPMFPLTRAAHFGFPVFEPQPHIYLSPISFAGNRVGWQTSSSYSGVFAWT